MRGSEYGRAGPRRRHPPTAAAATRCPSSSPLPFLPADTPQRMAPRHALLLLLAAASVLSLGAAQEIKLVSGPGCADLPPAPPTALRATPSDGTVLLTWDRPANGACVTEYQVSRVVSCCCPAGGGIFVPGTPLYLCRHLSSLQPAHLPPRRSPSCMPTPSSGPPAPPSSSARRSSTSPSLA